MSLTVTVNQTNSSKNGICIRTLVLTNAATGISGLVGGQTGVGAHRQNSQTPFDAFSEIYGIIFNGDTDGSLMAGLLPGQTVIDTIELAAIGQFLTFKEAVPNPPVSTNYGSAASFNGGLAFAEILAATSAGITQDGSTPALIDLAATSGTTASFTPPNGSLILVMAACPSVGSVAGLAITDSFGLTWTLLTTSASAGSGCQSIWAAFAPVTTKNSSDTATGTDAGEALHGAISGTDSSLSFDGGETVVQTKPYPTSDVSTGTDAASTIALSSTDAFTAAEAQSVFVGVTVFINSQDASTRPLPGVTPSEHDIFSAQENQNVLVEPSSADAGHFTDGH